MSDDIDRQRLINFDRSLTPGMTVEARWPVRDTHYTALATVVSFRHDVVRVRLLEDRDERFYTGWSFELARFQKSPKKIPKWSATHGVFPVPPAVTPPAPAKAQTAKKSPAPSPTTPKTKPSAITHQPTATPDAELFQRLHQLVKQTRGGYRAVAKEIKIPHEHLWRIIQGQRSPTIATLCKLYVAYPRKFKELRILCEPKKP